MPSGLNAAAALRLDRLLPSCSRLGTRQRSCDPSLETPQGALHFGLHDPSLPSSAHETRNTPLGLPLFRAADKMQQTVVFSGQNDHERSRRKEETIMLRYLLYSPDVSTRRRRRSSPSQTLQTPLPLLTFLFWKIEIFLPRSCQSLTTHGEEEQDEDNRSE